MVNPGNKSKKAELGNSGTAQNGQGPILGRRLKMNRGRETASWKILKKIDALWVSPKNLKVRQFATEMAQHKGPGKARELRAQRSHTTKKGGTMNLESIYIGGSDS